MKNRPSIEELKNCALEIRKDILKMLTMAGSGHTGGSLSIVELLVVLYWYKMRHKSARPNWPDRDRFVLSKGHGCPALYAVLAHQGYFPKQELKTLRKLGTRLQGHPQLGLPGIESSTGSLGQGLSIINGMAMAAKLDNKNIRCYCILGDGELQEGQIWEAAMTAVHYKLDNLCVIVDNNDLQIDGKIKAVMDIYPIIDKWQAFGWEVIEVDGHNMEQIMDALDNAETIKTRPTLIVARTVKGKGVSFIEHSVLWHGIAPKPKELEKALAELEGNK